MRNRFKGLDLIDRVPEELWMDVHDIVQEAVIKIFPKKKKGKKAKWLSEEAYTNSYEKKRSEKQRGKERKQRGRERFKHLNAEFQRIARRDKKACLSDQCKKERKTTEWEKYKSPQICR